MKLPRSVIGKVVEIIWRDPGNLKRMSVDRAPKGWGGMATWRERGVIDDITDNIVRLIPSEAASAPGEPDPDPLDIVPAYIHEALIEDCIIFDQRRSLKDGEGKQDA